MDYKTFIKIPGSSFNNGKEFEVASLGWGGGRGVNVFGANATSGQNRPSAGIKEFVITCPINNQTVFLQQAAVRPTNPFDVEIIFRKPLNRGWIVAQTYKAKSVLVSGYSLSSGTLTPTCAVTFNAVSITMG